MKSGFSCSNTALALSSHVRASPSFSILSSSNWFIMRRSPLLYQTSISRIFGSSVKSQSLRFVYSVCFPNFSNLRTAFLKCPYSYLIFAVRFMVICIYGETKLRKSAVRKDVRIYKGVRYGDVRIQHIYIHLNAFVTPVLHETVTITMLSGYFLKRALKVCNKRTEKVRFCVLRHAF
jgi:hypothetical protein